MTRYVFIGAGSIGSALGGLLSMHGRDVLLVARGAHAATMIDRGVRIRCPEATFEVPVPTVTKPDQARLSVDDVLVVTTKVQQAREALERWSDVPVHDGTGDTVGRAADQLPIFTAQNGVAGEEIALRYFDRVFAVCVWFPVVMIEPGEVIVRSESPRGIFHVGRYGISPAPRDDTELLGRVHRDWEPSGFRVIEPDDVMAWKYRKLLANLNNVLQALVEDAARARDVQQAIEAEARDILAAADIRLPDDEESQQAWNALSLRPVPGQPDRLGGSTWQSLIRGSGTIETDYLNGEIALIARRIGRSAPVNAGLAALARRAARDGLQPGGLTVRELRAQLDR